jgi:RNA polymerase sigma-70 factor, ECF subfamily
MPLTEQERKRLEAGAREACLRGDHTSAATIAVRGYGPEVLGFLMAIHRDEHEAADLFAQVTESLWTSLPTFAWNCSLRTWLYTIARNASRHQRRDAARREKRGRRVGASALDGVAQAVRTETLTFLRTGARGSSTIPSVRRRRPTPP